MLPGMATMGWTGVATGEWIKVGIRPGTWRTIEFSSSGKQRCAFVQGLVIDQVLTIYVVLVAQETIFRGTWPVATFVTPSLLVLKSRGKSTSMKAGSCQVSSSTPLKSHHVPIYTLLPTSTLLKLIHSICKY